MCCWSGPCDSRHRMETLQISSQMLIHRCSRFWIMQCFSHGRRSMRSSAEASPLRLGAATHPCGLRIPSARSNHYREDDDRRNVEVEIDFEFVDQIWGGYWSSIHARVYATLFPRSKAKSFCHSDLLEAYTRSAIG